jgi:RNA polymerase sigma-70 factor (ECF subfamily)
MEVPILPERRFCYNKNILSIPATAMKGKKVVPKESGALDFAELHRAYRPKILRYLSGMVGEAEAEDLVQDVFLKISRGLHQYQGRARISTWIYRIATNAAIDRLRQPSYKHRIRDGMAGVSFADRSASGFGDMESCPDGKAAPAETTIIEDEMGRCLGNYIDQLPARQRAVVILSFLEGLKNAEIAEILGVNIQTVKIRLHRGRARLVKELETHCGWFRDMRNHLTWDGKIL